MSVGAKVSTFQLIYGVAAKNAQVDDDCVVSKVSGGLLFLPKMSVGNGNISACLVVSLPCLWAKQQAKD